METRVEHKHTANCVGSPSELINVSNVLSHVPRSAKYLGVILSTWLTNTKSEPTHKSVLKRITTNKAKKPIARRACRDRRTDTYMTSIVLERHSSRAEATQDGNKPTIEGYCYSETVGRHVIIGTFAELKTGKESTIERHQVRTQKKLLHE